MTPEVEDFIQKQIFPDLVKGRPGWDKPHTEKVVYYLKEIVLHSPELALDEDVLLIAAYAHDWGYSGLFHKGKPASLQAVRMHKSLHMELGAQKVAELLKDNHFSYLSSDQKERIRYLVSVHDKLNILSDIDELVLMEADTLGALDPGEGVSDFSEVDIEQWLTRTKERRITRFITTYSKEKAAELISIRY
jgi:hypothetical protein